MDSVNFNRFYLEGMKKKKVMQIAIHYFPSKMWDCAITQVRGLEHLSYELGLFSLEKKWLQRDLIVAFQKEFFTQTAVKPWHSCLKKLLGSNPWRCSRAGCALGSLAWWGAARGWSRMSFKGPFQPKQFYNSMTLLF